MKSHLPKCTELVVKVEKSDDGTCQKTRTAYYVLRWAPQTITDSAWPDWRYWTAYDIVSILDWFQVWITSTAVENDQSRSASGVNSVRRAVYVKESIMRNMWVLNRLKGGIYSLTDPTTSRACSNTGFIESGRSINCELNIHKFIFRCAPWAQSNMPYLLRGKFIVVNCRKARNRNEFPWCMA